MKSRLIVAGIAVPALLVFFLYLPPIAVTLLVVVLSLLSVYELYGAVEKVHKESRILAYCAAALIPCFVALQNTGMVLLTGGVLLFLHFGLMIFCYEKETPLSYASLATCFFGGIVIPLALSCFTQIRQMEQGHLLALLPLVISFCSDGMAYFIGIWLGKHKLVPHVSPKKTIEGSVGGFLGGALGMVVFRLCTGSLLAWPQALLLGVLGSAVSQMGDLSFSVIKREFQIKDFGTLLPGHGGILDRFDSTIFVTPLVFWILTVF